MLRSEAVFFARTPRLPPPEPTGDSGRCVRVVDIVKDFHTPIGVRRVLDGISFDVRPGERMAVLGRNGAGKSTLIKILAGVQKPSSGHVHLGLKMSWPLALGGGFEPNLTGYDNMRFIAALYGRPFRDVLDYVTDFCEIGAQIYNPVSTYSNGMRARLAFGLSLAIDFECILIDEVLAVGDPRFQEKCNRELFERRQDRAMILAIHAPDFVRERCTSALVLKDGRGRLFQDVKQAADIYVTL
jgi:capsular polysaccharide transport system ATP-binding protein